MPEQQTIPTDIIIRMCPNCDNNTIQRPTLFNPDAPQEGEVWQCTVCLECIDFIRNNAKSIYSW